MTIKTICKKIIPSVIIHKIIYIRSMVNITKRIIGNNNKLSCGNSIADRVARGGVSYPPYIKNVRVDIRGNGNSIEIENSAYLNSTVFDIIGRNNSIQIENGVCLNNAAFSIRGNDNKIIIGEGAGCHLGCIITQYGHNTYCEIGTHTTIEQANFCVLENNSKIVVGKNCMISLGINIRTGDNHLMIDQTSGERINYAKDVIIKDHVWLGLNCTILKGTAIEKDSIVGYGSVVTKAFEESNVVIAGNPAKIVKRNVNFSSEECPPIAIRMGNFEY
jgi:acetyltransferase-like isoleucine patch superfamily enzyme